MKRFLFILKVFVFLIYEEEKKYIKNMKEANICITLYDVRAWGHTVAVCLRKNKNHVYPAGIDSCVIWYCILFINSH